MYPAAPRLLATPRQGSGAHYRVCATGCRSQAATPMRHATCGRR